MLPKKIFIGVNWEFPTYISGKLEILGKICKIIPEIMFSTTSDIRYQTVESDENILCTSTSSLAEWLIFQILYQEKQRRITIF